MAGLPVVASDLPEIRRVIASGTPAPGELFDASSPRSIARAITRVLADPHEYEARRREARRLALEHFNWGVHERRLLDLYAALRQENDGNLFVSPYSVSQALAMVYAGAKGETADQMAETLSFTLDPPALNEAFSALNDNLVTRSNAEGDED